jgi:hypothetical protein
MRRPDSKPRASLQGRRRHAAIEDGSEGNQREAEHQALHLLYNIGLILGYTLFNSIDDKSAG